VGQPRLVREQLARLSASSPSNASGSATPTAPSPTRSPTTRALARAACSGASTGWPPCPRQWQRSTSTSGHSIDAARESTSVRRGRPPRRGHGTACLDVGLPRLGELVVAGRRPEPSPRSTNRCSVLKGDAAARATHRVASVGRHAHGETMPVERVTEGAHPTGLRARYRGAMGAARTRRLRVRRRGGCPRAPVPRIDGMTGRVQDHRQGEVPVPRPPPHGQHAHGVVAGHDHQGPDGPCGSLVVQGSAHVPARHAAPRSSHR
jgi:hypothetical protein